MTPCDYLFPGETNAHFRLAVDSLYFQIKIEYREERKKIREIEQGSG